MSSWKRPISIVTGLRNVRWTVRKRGMRAERLDRTLTHIVIVFLLSVFGKLMLQQFWKINRRYVLEKKRGLTDNKCTLKAMKKGEKKDCITMKIWGRVVEQSGCMVDLQSKGPKFKSHLLTKLWLNCQRNQNLCSQGVH